jgi:hypothetical protein
MGRRQKSEVDAAMGVVQMLGALFLIALLYPPFRQQVIKLGLYATGTIIVVGVVAFGVILIRRSERKPHLSKAAVGTPQPTQSPLGTVRLAAVTPMVTPRVAPATLPAVTPKPAKLSAPIPPDLIKQLRTIDWFQFEQVVALTYHKLGYSVCRRGGANPDGGIDLVIQKDGVPEAVQCKHWKTRRVGVKVVREFLGALTDAGIKHGVLVTLGDYTPDAKQLAQKHEIEIVTEAKLAKLLEEADARFDPAALAILRDKRKYCPKCEAEMVLRTAKKGLNVGSQFWGCSRFPICRFRLDV